MDNACQFPAKLRVDAYKRIGASPKIIEWLSKGIPIPFASTPPEFHENNYIFTQEHEKFVDSEIQKLLLAGTIRKVNYIPRCVHPLKCVPKKNKLRLVTDCRSLNQHIHTPSFTQEGIAAVAELIKPGDELITVDLKNGFHHVPILKEHWTYVGICWRGEYYVWMFFPFGISCAPYFFYKTIRPVVTFLRENFIRVSPFVDDFLSMSQPSYTSDQKDFILNTFQDLGWQINWEKSSLQPGFEKVFVGYIISTNSTKGPWIRVTAQKIRKLRRSIKRCISLVSITARSLARITGQCISMTKAILPGKLLLRNAYRVLKTRQDWDSTVTLDPPAIADLQWWYSAVNNWNGAPLNQAILTAQVETDASAIGWGAVLKFHHQQQPTVRDNTATSGHLEASGLWSIDISYRHSNFRELLAVLMALLSFKHHLKNRHIQLLSDNVTTVAYINQLGGPAPELSQLMTTIWQVAQEHGIHLSARHLAGNLNGHADRLSRRVSPYDWSLNKSVFRHLNALWGPHTVDRFASQYNTQLPRFNSLFWNPGTEAVDAMAQDWRRENNFVNPPFWMLGRILHLVREQQVCATVIAPRWPGQRWFRLLKQMSVDQPIFIRNTEHNFFNSRVRAEPCKNKRWRIFAWRIDGRKCCKTKVGP